MCKKTVLSSLYENDNFKVTNPDFPPSINCDIVGKLFFFFYFLWIYLCRFSLIHVYVFLNITFVIIDRGSLWHFEECSSLRVQLPWQDQSEGQRRNDDLFPDRPKGHGNHACRWPSATTATSILCQSDTSQSHDQPTSPTTSSILKYRISKL